MYWKLNGELCVISIEDEDKTNLTVDNIPLLTVRYGAYQYFKQVVKWVEDN